MDKPSKFLERFRGKTYQITKEKGPVDLETVSGQLLAQFSHSLANM
jgi:hypothetical protein